MARHAERALACPTPARTKDDGQPVIRHQEPALVPIVVTVPRRRSAACHRTGVRRLALAAGALLVAVALGLAPGPAASPVRASCASPVPIPDAMSLAEVVLVGTVTSTENGGRWATVRVEERWQTRGSVPDEIAVHGGPEPGAETSIDRVYSPGRYLFFLTIGRGYYLDNACTATTAWTQDLAQFRPLGVAPAPDVAAGVPAGSRDPVDIVPVVALGVALLIALMSYGLILRARRRPPDWVR